jgi:succinate dehydrogenase / fumarate reductase cytochrome b subunit
MTKLGSSVGKKAVMAVLGLMLCLFLCIHLLGNIVVFFDDHGRLTFPPGGVNANEGFEWVAEHYSAVPLLFHVGEVLLLGLFALHAGLGLLLWWENRRARGPSRYVRSASEGGRTIYSTTMPYTGVCFILVFLVIHLMNFRFGDHENPAELYQLLGSTFQSGLLVLVYVVGLVGMAAHLAHGLQSSFQSLGLRHPRYTPWVRRLGYLFALVMLVGFASIPVSFFYARGVA